MQTLLAFTSVLLPEDPAAARTVYDIVIEGTE